MVPSIVEMKAAVRPIIRVFHKAPESECVTPPFNREAYNFSENPVQFPKTFASVKENIIMIRIGA
jgi:hypothetical protein